jgi:hypothetical protein
MINRKPKNTTKDLLDVTNNVAGLFTSDPVSDKLRETLHQTVSQTFFPQDKRNVIKPERGFIVM